MKFSIKLIWDLHNLENEPPTWPYDLRYTIGNSFVGVLYKETNGCNTNEQF